MMVQELEELLNSRDILTLLSVLCRGTAWWGTLPAQTDHVIAVPLRQTSPVAELLLRTRRQTLTSQSEQVLQAVDQPLVVVLKLSAALHLVAMAAYARLRLFQLPLNSQKRVQDSYFK